MKHGFKGISMAVVSLGLLAAASGRPTMAAARCLGSDYVIDMRAGSILLQDSEQSFAAYSTLQAMINNGVVDYNESWEINEYDLDQDGTKDLMLTLDQRNDQDVYIFTALSENSINGEVTVQINSATKDALLTDGYNYFEKLTFRYPDALPVLITGASVSGIEDKEYTGKAQTQSLTVKMSDLVLQEGTHYKVTYQNHTNVGTAAVTISGTGTCAGTITKSFKITGKAADSVVNVINALKAADAVTLADQAAVEAARAAYDKLAEAQKTLVPAAVLKRLSDAEAKIAGLRKEAANAVTEGKTYTVSKMNYTVTNADMTGKGTVTLSGTTVKKAKLKKLTVPADIKINGASFRVTAIGDRAFQNFKKLGTVTVGKNVASIGNHAFAGDKKLKKIKIRSAKLKSVGKKAVKGIQKRAVITVPKKQAKKYKKLFSSKTGFKKSMTIR